MSATESTRVPIAARSHAGRRTARHSAVAGAVLPAAGEAPATPRLRAVPPLSAEFVEEPVSGSPAGEGSGPAPQSRSELRRASQASPRRGAFASSIASSIASVGVSAWQRLSPSARAGRPDGDGRPAVAEPAADASPDGASTPDPGEAPASRRSARLSRQPRPSTARQVAQVISGFVAVLVGGLVVLVLVLPLVLGATPLTVLSSSMEPTYPAGSMVVVKPVDTATLRIGDTVTYQTTATDPTLITHRIIEVISWAGGEKKYVTQGDNNSGADDPITAEQIKGKVIYHVPYFGYVANAIGGGERAGWMRLLGVALLGYAGYVVVRGVSDRRARSGPS